MLLRRKFPLKSNYLLHNHILQPVEHSKYLGVTIKNDLDWGPHINNITTKANKILGFLRRNMFKKYMPPPLPKGHIFFE
jgi:hypothetical protein